MTEERQRLQAQFCKVDLDDNGQINFDEFVALLKTLGLTRQDDVVRLAFSKIDKDGSGQIGFSEFCAWWDASGSQIGQRA